MKIQGIFDDVDSAEHALFQLRSMGAEPKGYSISRLDEMRAFDFDSAYPIGGVGYMGASGESGFTGLAGGVWNNAGWNTGLDVNQLSMNQYYDGISREVCLTIECSDDEAARFQGALVSLHGRQVKKKS